MKILHLMSARKYVGEAARVLDLAEAQQSLGHTVRVAVRTGHAVEEEARRRGLPLLPLAFGSGFRPFRDYGDVRAIRRTIENESIEVLHCHRGKDHWLAAWAARGRYRRPLFRTRHVVMPIHNHWANRWLYNRATTGIVCVSNQVESVVRQSLPALQTPLQTIPGGIGKSRLTPDCIDAARALRKELAISSTAPVLTLLARLANVKGHRYAIDALPAILKAHPQAILLFAYNRKTFAYHEELKAQIAHLNMEDHVRWVESIPDISPLLQTTDIGLVASIGSEGWSRVTVECMAMGVPVVATTVGSLPEIVEEGKTGLLVAPKSSSAMATAVVRLLDDAALRSAMGQAGRERAAYYRAERMAEDVMGVYEIRSQKSKIKNQK